MNHQQRHELKSAIESARPLEEIVALLCRFKAQGLTQTEVYKFLEDWHRTGPEEATDDRILEVADFVAGFCASHMKVWTNSGAA